MNLFSAIFLVLLIPSSLAQLSQTETRILFQVQKLLEYPQVLQGWNNWTNFCFLPPSPSLKIVCSNGRVTELTVIGNRTSPSSHSSEPFQALSGTFSTDSFFTVLTKLSSLKVLSLVSLGLWGTIPEKINRFSSLEILNISSNFISGEIPDSISSMRNLKSVVFADNLLSGNIPDLTSLSSLEEVNFDGNKLGPEFPSIGNNIVKIILRKNSIRSQIPLDLSNFEKLQILDVSLNNLIGRIPNSIFSLPSLHYLNLSSNKFSGNLSMNSPCSSSSSLNYVDISHNFLVGKLPSCMVKSKAKMLYSWNCFSKKSLKDEQHSLSYCKRDAALAVKPPNRKVEKGSSMKLGLVLVIVGGVVGIACVLALIIVFILWKSKPERLNHNMGGSVAHKFSEKSNMNARHVPQTMRLGTHGQPPYNIFTEEEIEDATNNFDQSNLIGEGSQGQIYKGWLRNGSVVLINCIKIKQKGLPHSIMQQLDVLQNLRHRHMVSVLGHCLITHQDPPQVTCTVFIVHEYISNVSLRDQLTDGKKKDMLKWPQRMAISIGIARGVQFLHTGVAPGVFGNNLKIENILLDDSLNAKVSGYRIPLPSKSTVNEESDAEKEDIYQLGVILLEVITGRQITSSSEVEQLKDELERSSSEPPSSILRSTIDPSLRGSYAYESMNTAVQITINCLSKISSKRPSIEDVLWNLQYSMQVQESWTSSGNLSTKF
ncbi:probable LRR receptor-like serine/threonine-protein kinase At1g14390 [Lathyrus oleraceus]|uniref:non-specific serine/threonine protein kinase n=1 Tax=Pisum sativum TaxID=3888 RepID=A0A9D4XEX4_PEA|nr:probable LRR receptor-like serine/threonine-protein kinase At1g14390 [Pisum sativum]KAI5419938.1 hypothetical protein KIW84_043922 [Pisum sativum]